MQFHCQRNYSVQQNLAHGHVSVFLYFTQHSFLKCIQSLLCQTGKRSSTGIKTISMWNIKEKTNKDFKRKQHYRIQMLHQRQEQPAMQSSNVLTRCFKFKHGECHQEFFIRDHLSFLTFNQSLWSSPWQCPHCLCQMPKDSGINGGNVWSHNVLLVTCKYNGKTFLVWMSLLLSY